MRAIGYLRVSTQEQGDSGVGIEAQRNAIQAWSENNGQVVSVEWMEDSGFSAKDLKRPAVQMALSALARGDFDALVVSKLDRLSRSVVDFAGLMEQARSGQWGVVVLDMNIDTTTPMGEAMLNVMATFAQLERRLISQRTKEAMAVLKENGVSVGRPRAIPEHIRDVIWGLRIHEERTFAYIARHLNELEIPTGHNGNRWHASTVRGVVQSEAAERTSED